MTTSTFAFLSVPLDTPRPRGGWRQRCEQERNARSRSPPKRSYAAEKHLKSWASGIQSAAEMFSHAEALIKEGYAGPGSVRDFNCGNTLSTDGNQTKHMQHNLLSLMEASGLPQLVDTIVSDVCPMKYGVRPSSIFRLLHRCKPLQFQQHFGADKAALRYFWSGLFSSQVGREIKAANVFLRGKTLEQLDTMIPLAIHEDAGPFTKTKSTSIISWSPICGFGTDLETRIVCMSYIKVKGTDPATLQAGWDFCSG